MSSIWEVILEVLANIFVNRTKVGAVIYVLLLIAIFIYFIVSYLFCFY